MTVAGAHSNSQTQIPFGDLVVDCRLVRSIEQTVCVCQVVTSLETSNDITPIGISISECLGPQLSSLGDSVRQVVIPESIVG